jgi:hypothetical protein
LEDGVKDGMLGLAALCLPDLGLQKPTYCTPPAPSPTPPSPTHPSPYPSPAPPTTYMANITDTCTGVEGVAYWPPSHVGSILQTLPVALGTGVAQGLITQDCLDTALGSLSTSCITQLSIQNGCCDTGCSNTLKQVTKTPHNSSSSRSSRSSSSSSSSSSK